MTPDWLFKEKYLLWMWKLSVSSLSNIVFLMLGLTLNVTTQLFVTIWMQWNEALSYASIGTEKIAFNRNENNFCFEKAVLIAIYSHTSE